MNVPELKPCPFCGGEAERITLEDDENFGGDVICCTDSQASSNVEFGFKENLVANWNRRADLPPADAAVMNHPKVKALVEALNAMLEHSCVADAGADMKCAEDHAAERKARAALAVIQEDKT